MKSFLTSILASILVTPLVATPDARANSVMVFPDSHEYTYASDHAYQSRNPSVVREAGRECALLIDGYKGAYSKTSNQFNPYNVNGSAIISVKRDQFNRAIRGGWMERVATQIISYCDTVVEVKFTNPTDNDHRILRLIDGNINETECASSTPKWNQRYCDKSYSIYY